MTTCSLQLADLSTCFCQAHLHTWHPWHVQMFIQRANHRCFVSLAYTLHGPMQGCGTICQRFILIRKSAWLTHMFPLAPPCLRYTATVPTRHALCVPCMATMHVPVTVRKSAPVICFVTPLPKAIQLTSCWVGLTTPTANMLGAGDWCPTGSRVVSPGWLARTGRLAVAVHSGGHTNSSDGSVYQSQSGRVASQSILPDSF